MSKSILDLLGSMNSPKGVQQPTPENELYNPEIPDSSLAGTINSKAIIQDQYYNKMRLAKTRKMVMAMQLETVTSNIFQYRMKTFLKIIQ